MTKYRPDIDGLRAIAVVAVVLYHLGVDQVSAGFVGVDVFFVISGFLITGVLRTEFDANSFSYFSFYERRVRRLFPALFTILFISIPVALIILVPRDLEDFGQSIIASGLFSSNILFFLERGYFEGPSELKPLLHTWSLAVEEQYYLLYPLLMATLYRFKWDLGKGLVAICVLSFCYSIWRVTDNQEAAFYLLPSRIWELLLGGILLIYSDRVVLSRLSATITAITGFLLIAYSIFRFSEYTVFPGPAALIPCLGAALVILAGQRENLVSQIISSKGFVGLGLISYSLYLWHFPIIVFSKQLIVRPFEPIEMMSIFLLSVGLAFMTWRYIEQPFRGNASVISTRVVKWSAITAASLAVIFGLFTDYSDGASARFSPLALKYIDAEKNVDKGCRKQSTPCTVGNKDTEPEFLVWGDSHADSVAEPFRVLANESSVSGLISTRGGCLPLLNFKPVHAIGKSCVQHNKNTFEKLQSSDIKKVILIGRWTLAVERSKFKFEKGVAMRIVDDPLIDTDASNEDVLRRSLDSTLAQLTQAGKEVVILGPVPEAGWHVPHTLAQRLRFGSWIDQAALNPTYAEFGERNNRTLGILRAAAEKYKVNLVLPQDDLCTVSDGCSVMINDKPLYYDAHHLTPDGALVLLGALGGALKLGE